MQHEPHRTDDASGAADSARDTPLSEDEAALARRLGINGLSRREFLAQIGRAHV